MSDEAEARRIQLLETQTLFLALNDFQRAAAASILRSLASLGPKACKIQALGAERLAEGAVIGDFERGRDWKRNSMEELIDNSHYQLAALIESDEDEKKAAE